MFGKFLKILERGISGFESKLYHSLCNLAHYFYSCLHNPIDRGAWWATVHAVTKRVRHDLASKQHVKNK